MTSLFTAKLLYNDESYCGYLVFYMWLETISVQMSNSAEISISLHNILMVDLFIFQNLINNHLRWASFWQEHLTTKAKSVTEYIVHRNGIINSIEHFKIYHLQWLTDSWELEQELLLGNAYQTYMATFLTPWPHQSILF